MSTSTSTIPTTMIDWFELLQREISRNVRAGLTWDAATIAAVDVTRFRREIAGQSLRLQTKPAELVADADGRPRAVVFPEYDKTAFPADEVGLFDAQWSVGGTR